MSVPETAQISITMKGDNWAFGEVSGIERWTAYGLSERPAGTDKPLTSN